MRTSILICATCLIITGGSAQLRFPSLSSALSSLTGFGGGGSSSGSASSQSAAQSSPYSGLVRDYGRNLMMAMSSIYPTLFKPPQSQQQQAQPQASQSPFDQFSSASQNVVGTPQGYFSGQSGPSFSFGGSTFSISPSLPFGSLAGPTHHQGAPQQAQPASGPSSPFSASFGSSINSPSSFGPLSSSPFLSQSMPSFAPPSSYNAAFEAANGGPSSSFNALNAGPSPMQSNGASLNNAQLIPQSSNPSSINSFAPIPNFSGQHDTNAPISSQSAHQSQSGSMNQQSALGLHSSIPFPSPQQAQVSSQQYSSQQFRPDMMSIAASAPIPSSNSYANYGNMPSASSQQQQQHQQQAPISSPSYQQPSYR